MKKVLKFKDKFVNISTMIVIGLLVAMFFVTDRNVGMNLMAIAMGLFVFLLIIDEDLRRRF